MSPLYSFQGNLGEAVKHTGVTLLLGGGALPLRVMPEWRNVHLRKQFSFYGAGYTGWN